MNVRQQTRQRGLRATELGGGRIDRRASGVPRDRRRNAASRRRALAAIGAGASLRRPRRVDPAAAQPRQHPRCRSTSPTIDIPKSAYQVFGDTDYEPVTKNKTDLKLGGWGYCWLRLRRGVGSTHRPRDVIRTTIASRRIAAIACPAGAATTDCLTDCLTTSADIPGGRQICAPVAGVGPVDRAGSSPTRSARRATVIASCR